MTPFQQKVKESLEFDFTPGIEMLVTKEGVDAEELKHYALVKFFTEGEDILKLFNANTLLALVKMSRLASTDEQKLGAFRALMAYLNWIVYPIEHGMEDMLRNVND